MGFEKNEIEICISNMWANASMYRRLSEAKLSIEPLPFQKIACAEQAAWSGAAAMLEEAYKKFVN